MVGLFPTLAFTIVLEMYNFWYALIALVVTLFTSMMIGIAVLKNPFSSILEGKGLLTFNMDSTGILQPFIVGLNAPYIKGRLKGEAIEDIFDRNAVLQMNEPIELNPDSTNVKIDGNKFTFTLDKTAYNRARFQMLHFPVLIWNNQLKTFITKDFLSGQEKSLYSEHTTLYLTKKVEELINTNKNFARAVVDLLKPKGSWASSWIFWVILIGGIILVAVILMPKIVEMLGNSGVGDSVSNALQSAQPITQID